MQSHKNEKCEIDAREKTLVITWVQHTEPLVHFSLGSNSHSFYVQNRMCVKIFLMIRITFCIFTSDWPESLKYCIRNEEQGTSLDLILDPDNRKASLTALMR